MMDEKLQPWTSGSGEILKHGLFLLGKDSDINRRLAMIMIDNAVELMIKTFLGLPKRITHISVSKKEYQEISESFTRLIDGLEKHAPDKLDGIDLGTIEWYHRLRNELYHQGNGLTVERDKVEIYAEVANKLFKNLFGKELVPFIAPETELLGEFISAWMLLEGGMRHWASRISLLGNESASVTHNMRYLKSAGILDVEQTRELEEIRQLRNKIIHGEIDFKQALNQEIINKVRLYAELFDEA